MPEGKGYIISAQKPTPGMKTTGGSAIHNKMKPRILNTPAPKDMAACTDNKRMYKSKSGSASKGKMSY